MPATPYGVYRAGYVPQDAVEHVVHHHDGSTSVVAPPTATSVEPVAVPAARAPSAALAGATHGPARRVPLGTVVHARSGDKGGDANLGCGSARATHGPPSAPPGCSSW